MRDSDFRIDLLAKQYDDLENEFRMALQIEASRFREVKEQVSCKSMLQHVLQKWQHSRKDSIVFVQEKNGRNKFPKILLSSVRGPGAEFEH